MNLYQHIFNLLIEQVKPTPSWSIASDETRLDRERETAKKLGLKNVGPKKKSLPIGSKPSTPSTKPKPNPFL